MSKNLIDERFEELKETTEGEWFAYGDKGKSVDRKENEIFLEAVKNVAEQLDLDEQAAIFPTLNGYLTVEWFIGDQDVSAELFEDRTIYLHSCNPDLGVDGEWKDKWVDLGEAQSGMYEFLNSILS